MEIMSWLLVVFLYKKLQIVWELHTHIHLTVLFPGLPRSAGTRKAKPIWVLLKQETVSGSGISWAICKSASLQTDEITTPAPYHSVFYRPDALSATQPTVSKHWNWNIPLPLIWSKIDSGRSACPVPSIDVSSLSYMHCMNTTDLSWEAC